MPKVASDKKKSFRGREAYGNLMLAGPARHNIVQQQNP